ncbi:DUF4139 domain-containing protein [Hydrogenophaga sp. PAMC20947]|uniref:DUF4139 domain-containing protein n=1 Tax=Hydrogenophaga sp. PAMC20947 TaxID=2565558 RepID=UPI00109DB82D|nr:DUF4139 domain-containing protein [Hydrogenophaga sp. PAMC20947]QCB48361.1 mucoidy inhibitor MuiA family protein [Hydrogenophaga sp. PAMC20947]
MTHHFDRRFRPTLTVLGAALLVAGPVAWAQSPGAATASSSIALVTLYPGSAKVERVAKVSAGARTLTFSCLPAALDVASLAVSADAPARLGEVAVLTEAREAVPACSGTPLDGRIRLLEDKKAVLGAEDEAIKLATGYLKGVTTGGDGAGGVRQAADPKTVAAMVDTVRRTGQEALLRQHQIDRAQEALDRELNPLLAERSRVLAGRGRVTTVSITLDAPQAAEVRLVYQINGPGWAPTYRALLDTQTGALKLERQAQVAQATGEDWTGVPMRLSTGQPRRGTAGPLPRPWRIDIAQPRPEVEARKSAMAGAPAPVMAMAERESAAGDASPSPSFDVSVFDNAYATEFVVPQRIDVPSSGERVTLALGSQALTAKLVTRTTPASGASAWLVAEVAQPEGVWPQGTLQLYRDGAYVGSDNLRTGGKGVLSLPFGLDELTVVRVEPEQDQRGSAGFVGSRVERTVARAYTVENRHRSPIQLQVLESAPVSVDEKVEVGTRFEPQPETTTWHEQPGVALWSQPLAAGQTARFTANYTISYPKDANLQERR